MAHSYVEGIKVKISEKYKPPFRISKSQQQYLMLNEKLQEELPGYDFGLEKTMLEKINIRKEHRRNMLEERKQRLSQKREEHKQKIADEMTKKQQTETNIVYDTDESGMVGEESSAPKVPSFPSSQALPSQTQQNYITKNGILMPIPAAYGRNILNPLQAYEHQQLNNVKSFNLSDFESDTSSPFDNMELKSINDLEELAQVLKSNQSSFPSSTSNYQPSLQFNNTHVSVSQLPQNISYNKMANSYDVANSQFNQNHYPYMPSLNNYPSYTANPLNGYVYNSIPQTVGQASGLPNSQYQLSSMRKSQCKSVPDLAKEMENTHLTNVRVDANLPIPVRPKSTDNGYPKGKTKDGTSELLESLSKEEREMCHNVSLMGFPIDRVARICKIVGCDQKKVVDHLLALSELLDLGFSEKPASEALLINGNDRDKALDLLIS